MAKKENDELLNIDNNVQEQISKTEAYIEQNSNKLLIIFGVAILLILGVWALNKYYFQARKVRAQEEMVICTQYFEKDSFNLALNGDGVNAGFLEIIDLYGSTAPGKIANFYAGTSYYHLGQFEEAISYLKKATNIQSDDYATVATGLIGDCYIDLNNINEGIKYFEKAANMGNDFTAPTYLKKAGLAYEHQNNKEAAIKCYQTIKDKYPKSQIAVDIDKYLERAKQ